MSILRVISSTAATLSMLLCVAVPCGCQQKKGAANPRQYPEHYLDGCDTGRMDTDAIEQLLVDYIYLIMNTPSPDLRRKCWQTIARKFPDSQPNRTVVEYLGEPDSPLYAPAMLEEYLVTLTEIFPSESMQRVRVDYLLEGIRKNKPGTRIADLRLVLADGIDSTLHKLVDESESGCLLLFYDPECEECSALITKLATDGEAGQIIAVSVTGEVKELPAHWLSARAADAEELDANFYLPRLPKLYKVQSDGKILNRF